MAIHSGILARGQRNLTGHEGSDMIEQLSTVQHRVDLQCGLRVAEKTQIRLCCREANSNSMLEAVSLTSFLLLLLL